MFVYFLYVFCAPSKYKIDICASFKTLIENEPNYGGMNENNCCLIKPAWEIQAT